METNTDIAQIKESLKSKKNGDFVSLKFSSEDKPCQVLLKKET